MQTQNRGCLFSAANKVAKTDPDTLSYDEAMRDIDNVEKWKEAVRKEIDQLESKEFLTRFPQDFGHCRCRNRPPLVGGIACGEGAVQDALGADVVNRAALFYTEDGLIGSMDSD